MCIITAPGASHVDHPPLWYLGQKDKSAFWWRWARQGSGQRNSSVVQFTVVDFDFLCITDKMHGRMGGLKSATEGKKIFYTQYEMSFHT